MKNQAEKNRLYIAIAVVLLVLIIILYFITLGKINLADQEEKKRKRLKWIEDRLQYLNVEAKSKQELKEQLDKKVKKYFLWTRVALALLYIIINVLIFIFVIDYCQGINECLATLLNYNQLVVIIVLIILYIRFETPSEFRDVFKLIHLLISKMVYKNHAGLETEIQNINKEIEDLVKEKEDLVNPEN